MTELGRMIRDGRHRRGLSQRELAFFLGISHVHVGNYERGDAIPKNIDEVARLLWLDPIALHEAAARCAPLRIELRGVSEEYRRMGVLVAARIQKQDIDPLTMKQVMSLLGARQ